MEKCIFQQKQLQIHQVRVDSLSDQTYSGLVSLLMDFQLAILQSADLHGPSPGQVFQSRFIYGKNAEFQFFQIQKGMCHNIDPRI